MKKLTLAQFGRLMQLAFVKQAYSQNSLGYEVFRSLETVNPELAFSLKSTGADCSYNDNKIIHFVSAIVE